MMKVLITGAAGFIGSHLVERYLHRGWTVTALDDLSTGSRSNLTSVSGDPRFSLRIGSVLDEASVNELVGEADLVIHLAAVVGVRLVIERPLETINANVAGTANVLQAAAAKSTRVIIASTSEVYGASDTVPFRECHHTSMGPSSDARWCYAYSKALDEALAFAYFREKRVPITIIRLFNTVGPRQTGRYGMVLPSFVGQALLGDPVTVFGTGAQRRCFALVDDVVEAIDRVALAPASIGEIVNIGAECEISIGNLAELVISTMRSTSKIVYRPYDAAYGYGFRDIMRRVPSLEKLQRLTGYRPQTPIAEIVKATIDDALKKIALRRGQVASGS